MTKISARVEKKVPIAGIAYSSQAFEANLEINVDDEAAGDEAKLQAMFAQLYKQCIDAVHAQIEAANESGDTVKLMSRL